MKANWIGIAVVILVMLISAGCEKTGYYSSDAGPMQFNGMEFSESDIAHAEEHHGQLRTRGYPSGCLMCQRHREDLDRANKRFEDGYFVWAREINETQARIQETIESHHDVLFDCDECDAQWEKLHQTEMDRSIWRRKFIALEIERDNEAAERDGSLLFHISPGWRKDAWLSTADDIDKNVCKHCGWDPSQGGARGGRWSSGKGFVCGECLHKYEVYDPDEEERLHGLEWLYFNSCQWQ